MTAAEGSTLARLLDGVLGAARARRLFATVAVAPVVLGTDGRAARAVIAQGLAMVLFDDLLARVPIARDYVAEVVAGGAKVVFDHGALRTVAGGETGALPPGDAAFARILGPLGYAVADVYPLERIKMTGRAWRHRDHPADIPQYFVSELHPERFSADFQRAVDRVLATSRDPLTAEAKGLLGRLEAEGALDLDQAVALLPVLAACFDRQHDAPRLDDYETLLAESAEMAWIATEGNAFNHATDRVADIEAVAEAQRRKGRPIKDAIELSSNGRVRQTAFRAALVARDFVGPDGATLRREVPGSFYEFVSRDPLPDGSGPDLGFDPANAQAIFRMTSAR